MPPSGDPRDSATGSDDTGRDMAERVSCGRDGLARNYRGYGSACFGIVNRKLRRVGVFIIH